MKVGFRIGRVAEATLLCLSAFAEGGSSQLVWKQAAVLRELRRRLRGLDRSNARRTIAGLRRAGLVVARGNGLALSAAGRQIALKRSLGIETPPLPRVWDGRWRIVAFDVPNLRRLERDALRAALEALGFEALQKSVWAHPAPCERQVAKVVAALGLDTGVAFIVSEKLNDDRKLRQKFRL